MATTQTTIERVHIYRYHGAWCYAAFTSLGFDHSDTLDAATEADARKTVARWWPDASVRVLKEVQ